MDIHPSFRKICYFGLLSYSSHRSEHAGVGVNLLDHEVGSHDGDAAADRLQERRSGRHVDVGTLQQSLVNVNVDGLGDIDQRTGVTGCLIEQTEVAAEDGADGHDKHDADDGAQTGNGDVLGLLPLGGAVDEGGFIHFVVDAADGSKVYDHAVAHALPLIQENQEIFPEVLVRVPGMFAVGKTQTFADIVDQAGVGGQEGVYEVADNYLQTN